MPVEAPVMRTDGIVVMALLFSLTEPIFMTDIMIAAKYDRHHVTVNGAGGDFCNEGQSRPDGGEPSPDSGCCQPAISRQGVRRGQRGGGDEGRRTHSRRLLWPFQFEG